MVFLQKNKPLAVIFIILTVAVMIMIFMFSADSAEESEALSQSLLDMLVDFIGQFISHNTLRKIAHFTEFAALGFCLTGSTFYISGKKNFPLPFLSGALYAVSDEIHQHFVPERACRVFDMFIDSCGVATGIGVFMILILIIKKICDKNRLAD